MSDDTQIQSSEPKTYESMPLMEEFETLDSTVQKELINKFGVQDQEEEKSEPSSTEEETSTEVQPESKDEKPETEEVKQDEKPVEEKPDVEKKYKELEAEFTRRSQKLRDLERKVEELSKAKQGQESEVKSPLDKLVETNPNAKELVEAIREEVRLNLTKGLATGIKPIQDRLTQQTADENFNKFQSEVKEFLGSPLGKLETEFNSIAAEYYESQDALLDAARKDPELFSRLKEKAISRNFVKAAKLMGETVSHEDKNRKVKDTGISGKAKTTTTVDDELDLKVFNKKSPEEMKAILDRHGAVKHD
jgi:sRNA-binding protein